MHDHFNRDENITKTFVEKLWYLKLGLIKFGKIHTLND